MEIFGRSRRQLTLAYALIMCVFLAVLIFVVHVVMDWSMFSEQAQELSDASNGVAEAQVYYLQHPGVATDENRYYKNLNDRLFFYIFDEDKQLVDFVRASFRIEQFVLGVIDSWSLGDEEVEVFSHSNESGQITTVMMTSKTIYTNEAVQKIYVGKDVTALYSGLQKATYAQIFLGVLALIIATIIGHIMSGRAIVPLKSAYDKQKQFAADASHELRTPLAVVMASADLLLSDPTIKDPFLRQVLEDLKSEVKKMTALVSDLLFVARSDNNAINFKPQKFDLGNILKQTVRMMVPLADKKRVNLVGENFTKILVSGDEQKIKQLILILVDNAIKYTQEGGTVVVRIESITADKVIFSVQDNGIGIAPEDVGKIFDRFFRVDKARSREMGGNGLGLSIASEIIKLHDGKITVASELDRGTKFNVELRINLKK